MPALSQTMTKDQTIAAALQVTVVLIILVKSGKNGTLGRNVCDSHKVPAAGTNLVGTNLVGTNLPLVGTNGRQPKSCFAVNPKPQLLLKESEITKLPRFGTALYVREADKLYY